MKKILLFLVLGVFVLGDIDIVPKDPSAASVFYSALAVMMPSYASKNWSEGSSEASEESSGIKEKETASDTYEYYKKMAEKKVVNAGEVFTENGLNKLGLLKDDIVELQEINIGILVTNDKKNLALIPSKSEYYKLVDRVIR